MHGIRTIFVALCATALCVTGDARGQALSYNGFGIGGQIGFVILENRLHPVDAAFDFGALGDLRYQLGRIGRVHYRPGIGLWVGGDHQPYLYRDLLGDRWTQRHWRYLEVRFDIGDIAYFFPVPATSFAHPYAGGGFSLLINRWSWEDDYLYDSDTRLRTGFNFFGGVELRLRSNLAAFAELRGKLSNWDVFRCSIGMVATVAHP